MEWLTTLLRSFGRPFQWWVTVGPWERGIRIRLGKTAADLAPGVHFRIPFLDRVYVQSIRLRTLWTTNLTTGTRDGHTATLSMAIDFAITDLRLMFDSFSSPELTLKHRASSMVADLLSRTDKADTAAVAIERYVNGLLADFGGGLGQIRFRVTGLAFTRTYRLLVNDYGENAGLGHNYDKDPA